MLAHTVSSGVSAFVPLLGGERTSVELTDLRVHALVQLAAYPEYDGKDDQDRERHGDAGA